jgi:MYXO-CTERM domain-containing protein
MRSQTLSTLVKAGALSLALAAGPLSGGVFAQATDPSRTPTDDRRTTDTRDDDFDWGWLGLVGLIGLMGLRRRDEPRTHSATQTSHVRP